MSSSANRRPRVAGQRRRPARDASTQDLPQGKGRDHDTDDAVAPSESDADVVGPGTGDGDTDEPAADLGDDHETAADQAEDHEPAADLGKDQDTVEPARGRHLVPALALALSLALLATVLLVTRHDPEQRSRDASAARATARSTLEQVLSYNHETMTQQIPANQALLTGKFKDEFAATMTKTIVPLAQKDKTVVKARAYEVGVMSQTEDTVVVQAFVNQARTSDTQKEPSVDQNRVIATMEHVGNRWLVSALKAY